MTLSCKSLIVIVVVVVLVKAILTVMKQLKELQRKPGKNSEASMGFKPMTSTIPVQCSIS